MASSTALSPLSSASEDEDYDRTARVVLQKKGFDPEDVNKTDEYDWTPILYFSSVGDLKMCRYLLSRGADCCKRDRHGFFPMYWAAIGGHLEICIWLFHHGGAHNDIRRCITRNGSSPLHVALINDRFDVVQWLILNGALGVDGVIDDATMRNNLRPLFWDDDKRLPVLVWARDAVTTHDNMTLVLTGTILSSSSVRRCHPTNPYATRSNKRRKGSPSSLSPLILFAGKPGILKLVAAYTGYPKANDLRIFRQLIDLLPAFIEDVPFVEEEEEDEDEDE